MCHLRHDVNKSKEEKTSHCSTACQEALRLICWGKKKRKLPSLFPSYATKVRVMSLFCSFHHPFKMTCLSQFAVQRVITAGLISCSLTTDAVSLRLPNPRLPVHMSFPSFYPLIHQIEFISPLSLGLISFGS